MRTNVLKWLLISSALLFADWIIMIILGCFSSLCHADNRFFCSVYCYIGIVLLSFSALILGYLILKKLFPKKHKNQPLA